MIQFKNLIIDNDRKLCTINKDPIKLSKREYNLLYHFLSNPNKIYSKSELINLFWNKSESENTVITTISRLRKKLQEYGNYIQCRSGFGYEFVME